jgi:hypothetical protein
LDNLYQQQNTTKKTSQVIKKENYYYPLSQININMSTPTSNHIPSTPKTNNPYVKSMIKTRNKMSFDQNITEDDAMNLAIEANKKEKVFDNHHKGWGDETDSEDEKKSPPKPSEINQYRHVNDTLNYDSDAPKIYLPTKQ